MPIYEYRCSNCQHDMEALQRFSDAPLSTCPQCGKETLVKQVSAAGFQLKGSGWYATDFKGSGGKPAKKSAEGDAKPAETKAASTGEGKSGSGTETKSGDAPAAKSESTTSTPATGSTPAST